MNKKIQSALISVFYKDGLEEIITALDQLSVKLFSTGGTQKFIESLGIACTAVESLTSYPSILSGRVKTLHPAVFGGILGKRSDSIHAAEMKEYQIPEIDLVIVDLYPFEDTVKEQSEKVKSGGEFDEAVIIEKIDIGGPSMIRAAAKNFQDVVVIANKKQYPEFSKMLTEQNGETSLLQRREYAIKAFDVCAGYDIAISNYFNKSEYPHPFNKPGMFLRYGENPHQEASFYGDTAVLFSKLHGKELSYNNLADVDAAFALMKDLKTMVAQRSAFAIIKHTNVCGVAIRNGVAEAWKAALESDPESAFGGVLITNAVINPETANAISEIFFEVLIAPSYDEDALQILKVKKNRILLKQKNEIAIQQQFKSILNGVLMQQTDEGNFLQWQEAGGRSSTADEKADLELANIICKHLKSNAIAIVKNQQLSGKGCGQTSRIDALRQAIQKANQFTFNLKDAVLSSDAFFPFDDCVKIAHEAGVSAFIQPGGSIRDKDSIAYCVSQKLVMVITGMRHFKH
ncbi:MAG: bifunctional phosphoribosylaminoimidazolecarboxamide formyltransferase/IMP cyclohydrolase [Ginsengibacter sp.]